MSKWTVREDQFKDWLGGVADGGPNGDGRYPLSDAQGDTILVECPAALASSVSGPAASAAQSKADAEAALLEVNAKHTAVAADTQFARAHREDALGFRNEAEMYADRAAASDASVVSNTTYSVAVRDEISLMRDVILPAYDGTLDAADRAATSAVTAELAADRVAAADLSLYATKAQLSTEVAALVGSAPEALNTLAEFSTALGDDPNFSVTITNAIASKAPLVHTHQIADVDGLQAALNAKASWTHTHALADVEGLVAALAGKAASNHAHDDYMPKTGGEFSGSIKAVSYTFAAGGGLTATEGGTALTASSGNYIQFVKELGRWDIRTEGVARMTIREGEITCFVPVATSVVPTVSSHLTNKSYVDARVATAMPKGGGTFTGNIVAPLYSLSVGGSLSATADYSRWTASSGNYINYHVANNQWEVRLASSVNFAVQADRLVANVPVFCSLAPTSGSYLANKTYVDAQVATRAPTAHSHALNGMTGGMSRSQSLMFTLAGNIVSEDVFNAPIELREVNQAGAGDGSAGNAPAIVFHWAGRIATALKMYSDGSIRATANGTAGGLRPFVGQSFRCGEGNLGGAVLRPSDVADHSGRVDFNDAAGNRMGYIGNVNASWLSLNTDGGRGVLLGSHMARGGYGAFLHHNSTSHMSGAITVSTADPSGGADGDIWLKVT